MYIDNRYNGMGVLSYSVCDGHFRLKISSDSHNFIGSSLRESNSYTRIR